MCIKDNTFNPAEYDGKYIVILSEIKRRIGSLLSIENELFIISKTDGEANVHVSNIIRYNDLIVKLDHFTNPNFFAHEFDVSNGIQAKYRKDIIDIMELATLDENKILTELLSI